MLTQPPMLEDFGSCKAGQCQLYAQSVIRFCGMLPTRYLKAKGLPLQMFEQLMNREKDQIDVSTQMTNCRGYQH